MIKNEVIEQADKDIAKILDKKRKLAAQLHEDLDIKVEVKEEVQKNAFTWVEVKEQVQENASTPAEVKEEVQENAFTWVEVKEEVQENASTPAEVKEEVQENASTPADPSKTQIVSFKYIFDLMQEQDKPSINTKLEFVEDKLLASEELTGQQIHDLKHNFAVLKTEFKRRWRDSQYKLSRFLSNNHEWLQGTLEIPRINNTSLSAPKSFERSGECLKRRKTEHLRNIDLNTLPTQSELYQAENNRINSKKRLERKKEALNQNENVPKENNPRNAKKRLVEAPSQNENVPKKSNKTRAKASTIKKKSETQAGDQIAQDISIIADIEEEIQEDASTQEVQGSSISSDQFAFLKGKVCKATLNFVAHMGFTTMTEFQAQVIPPLLEGRDLVGAAPMGSGKILAFLIPAIELIYKLKSLSPCETCCIILLPTRVHALKVFGVLHELRKHHRFTYTLAMEYETKDEVSNILVTTPGRLLFNLTNTPAFSYKNLQCLVIDGADLILAKWSYEFKQIIELLPATRQSMIFTTEAKNIEALTAFAVKEEPIYVGLDVKSEEATDEQEQRDDSIELSEYEDENEMLGDNPWKFKDDWRWVRVVDEWRRYDPEQSESSSSWDDELPVNFGSESEDDDYDLDERRLARAPEPNIIRDLPDDDDLGEHLRSKISALERDMDEAHDQLLEMKDGFNWKSSFDTFTGVREHFSGPTPGPVKEYNTPYAAFVDIWDQNIMQHIVVETNRYAKQAIAAEIKNGTQYPLINVLQEWVETSVRELYVLFAVFISMSLDRKIKLEEYWSSWHPFHVPKRYAFNNLNHSRFVLLCKFLHFVDSLTCLTPKSEHGSEVPLDGRVRKLQPIIDLLNAKFTSLYNLNRDICIDESLILFRGYLTWIQSIQIRPSRFEMKSSEICEALTGYLYKFDIYTGTTADAPITDAVTLGGETTKVLNKLMDGLWNRGHCLTMGNFYNSPALARYLKHRGTDCIGTLRPTRKHVPSSVRMASDARRGTSTSQHSGDVSINSWKDSKPIIHISTFHDDSTITEARGRSPCLKPTVVKGYERRMKLLNLNNLKLNFYFSGWSSGFGRWSINVFSRLFNASVHNAWIMFNESHRRRGFAVMTESKFRYKLSKALIKKHGGVTGTLQD